MAQSPQKVFSDIFEIFLDFLKSPLAYLRSSFHRETTTLFVYAGIIFVAIGFLGLGLSLIDGMADIFGLISAVLTGSMIAYAHLFLICFLVYLYFHHKLKEDKSKSEWVSTFFLASLPYWTACIIMNFATRAALAFNKGGFALIFYSFCLMELLRLAGLVFVLWQRCPKQRKNYLTWLVVVLIFIAVNYPKFKDSFAMLTFDMNALPGT